MKRVWQLVLAALLAGMMTVGGAGLAEQGQEKDMLLNQWREADVEEIGEVELSALMGDPVEQELLLREDAINLIDGEEFLRLHETVLVLGVGESEMVYTNLEGCRFESDNPAVATITGNGMVTARRTGMTAITVTSPGGQEAYCRIEVKKAPGSLRLSQSRLTIPEGQSASLDAILPGNTASRITYDSSNLDVVQIEADGCLYAVGVGTAKVTARTFNGRKATCSVTVEHARDDSVHYRALLIGESEFLSAACAPLSGRKNVSRMENMLRSVKGPLGNGWQIQTGINRTTAEIYDDIRTAFAGAKDDDVSLFYISTHGERTWDISTSYYSAGQLSTYDGNLRLPALAESLSRIPGRIVVLIDSCGSGVAIYGANGEDRDSLKAFDHSVVEAFSALDNGVTVSNAGKPGAFVRVNKFYVMTSAAYHEYGWDGVFSECVTAAVGTRGRMPGDSDRNKFLTLSEWYAYAQNKVKNRTFRWRGQKYRALFQVYPAGSRFEIMFRK